MVTSSISLFGVGVADNTTEEKSVLRTKKKKLDYLKKKIKKQTNKQICV